VDKLEDPINEFIKGEVAAAEVRARLPSSPTLCRASKRVAQYVSM
jgi:hypothetical protein